VSVSWSCCNSEFSSGNPENALRALAKHLEVDHGIPREAAAKFLQADANVREFETSTQAEPEADR